jgi:hypothetical protein
MALNLVACGASGTATVPCWFPDQHIVTLTDDAGASRDMPLEGFSPVTAQALLATDNPRRPILDAFVTTESDLWVLGSGEAPPGTPMGRRGGWLLARYDGTGRLVKRTLLPEQTRLLLRATTAGVTVLTWNGSVVEVRP